MKRQTCLILLCINIFIMLSGCNHPSIVQKKPSGQPNTMWVSKDGKIEFSVDENGYTTGMMTLEGQSISVHIGFEPETGCGMHIYPESEIRDKDTRYEYWSCTFWSEKQFTATVEETTFFRVGQKIIFYRQDSKQGDGSPVT